MLRVPLCTQLPLLALLPLLGAAHGVYVSLRCHRAGTLRRREAGRGRGKPRLCRVGIRVTLDHRSERAGGRGAGGGPAARRGRAGRAGRASFLVAGARGFRCGTVRAASRFVHRGPGLAEVRPSLSTVGFWGEGLQAARGCEGAPRAVAWGAILAERSGRKKKMGSGVSPAVGVTGIFALGDFSLSKRTLHVSR